MSLLMVPTNSPFADLSSTQGTDTAAPEEDFYLHLNLPPELDLPLPATTQIYHQPPRSYLIPRWDLGPEAGSMAADLAGGVKNVGLVYVDVTGVSRRAIIKSVDKENMACFTELLQKEKEALVSVLSDMGIQKE